MISVKLHLNTLSLKLTFSSENRYQKISRRTACWGPCPSGKEVRDSSLTEGKIYLSRTRRQGFFRALLIILWTWKTLQFSIPWNQDKLLKKKLQISFYNLGKMNFLLFGNLLKWCLSGNLLWTWISVQHPCYIRIYCSRFLLGYVLTLFAAAWQQCGQCTAPCIPKVWTCARPPLVELSRA